MRELWQGGVVSHHGRFFDFDEIEMRPVPTEPVPFYCGGKSAAAIRRAATLCDGFIDAPSRPIEEVPRLVAELHRLRREAGRDHLPFEIWASVSPFDPNRGPDFFKRLEDMGVTCGGSPPFDRGGADRGQTAGLGRRSTIEEKKAVMERFAENVIHKMT